MLRFLSTTLEHAACTIAKLMMIGQETSSVQTMHGTRQTCIPSSPVQVTHLCSIEARMLTSTLTLTSYKMRLQQLPLGSLATHACPEHPLDTSAQQRKMRASISGDHVIVYHDA